MYGIQNKEKKYFVFTLDSDHTHPSVHCLAMNKRRACAAPSYVCKHEMVNHAYLPPVVTGLLVAQLSEDGV